MRTFPAKHDQFSDQTGSVTGAVRRSARVSPRPIPAGSSARWNRQRMKHWLTGIPPSKARGIPDDLNMRNDINETSTQATSCSTAPPTRHGYRGSDSPPTKGMMTNTQWNRHK